MRERRLVGEAPDVGWVTCAKCDGKVVDRIETNKDVMRQETIYSIYCHGEVETVRVEVELIHGSEHVTVVDYVAFQNLPALPAPLKELAEHV